MMLPLHYQGLPFYNDPRSVTQTFVLRVITQNY